MIIINFSHPLTEAQMLQIGRLAGQDITKVIDVKTQFNHADPFVEQMKTTVQNIPLESKEWQNSGIIINIPSLNVIAALLWPNFTG